MHRFALIALLSLAAPAAAQPPAATAPQAEAAKEKVVCRREPAIGSNVRGRRVCTTAKQREMMSQSTQRELLRTNGFGGPNNASSPGQP